MLLAFKSFMEDLNQQLINSVRQGDISAFEELYKKYYVYLCLVAEHIVRSQCDAEEVVSDVFVKLWNLRERILITTSLKAYLVKAVHNTSLNYIEQKKTINSLTDSLSDSDHKLLAWDSDYPLGHLYEREIMDILDKGINSLPEACRNIFMLSRGNGLKYSEIASKLGLSVNTIKTQMKIALSHLREHLKEYLIILLLFIVI
jgi:RNA polymerase sigma-70 factor (ECF subfamily)